MFQQGYLHKAVAAERGSYVRLEWRSSFDPGGSRVLAFATGLWFVMVMLALRLLHGELSIKSAECFFSIRWPGEVRTIHFKTLFTIVSEIKWSTRILVGTKLQLIVYGRTGIPSNNDK
jgi:hypothetical protein